MHYNTSETDREVPTSQILTFDSHVFRARVGPAQRKNLNLTRLILLDCEQKQSMLY